MAVTGTNLTTSGQQAGSTATTASVSPGTNKLIILTVTNTKASSPAETPTVSGASMTWTQIRTMDDGSGRRITMFRALSASPGSGALTISFGGVSQTGSNWTVNEFDGIDTGGTNGTDAIVQSADNKNSGTTTGITVTLAAFGSVGNATHGTVRNNAANPAVGSGFTQLSEFNTPATNVWMNAEFLASNDTTVDWTWSSTSNSSIAMAIEIKAAATTSIKTINNLAKASVKTVNGLAIASVKTWNGLA